MKEAQVGANPYVGAGAPPRMIANAVDLKNVGSFKDFILSIFTFGIYALLKISLIEKQAELIRGAITDLHARIERGENAGGVEYQPGFHYVETKIEGMSLKVAEEPRAFGPESLLCISVDSQIVSYIQGMSLEQFGERLRQEINAWESQPAKE
ncbi:hypothetical protein IAG25_34875 [Caballeronia sp. EK]|uniref:hypothetical protein n=1 Tax=Caballeronia sp. EK TaxID=2767469 RepID=UPI001654D57E|nr:hypothetical protein [Caballeronia sp. EK]MBC8642010.1 hypothetical protein [Caballeronia sp. EK]